MKEIQQIVDEYYFARPVMRQYDTPSRLVELLKGEVGEVGVEFTYPDVDIEAVGKELADVVIYTMLMANMFSIDLETTVLHKLAENHIRFPEYLFDGSTQGTFQEIYARRKIELGEWESERISAEQPSAS